LGRVEGHARVCVRPAARLTSKARHVRPRSSMTPTGHDTLTPR
jgi:hypothetical protein